MLGLSPNSKYVLNAISKSQAIIEFDLTGAILTANENFCKALGYDLNEIAGKHHSMSQDPCTLFWPRSGFTPTPGRPILPVAML